MLLCYQNPCSIKIQSKVDTTLNIFIRSFVPSRRRYHRPKNVGVVRIRNHFVYICNVITTTTHIHKNILVRYIWQSLKVTWLIYMTFRLIIQIGFFWNWHLKKNWTVITWLERKYFQHSFNKDTSCYENKMEIK